MNPKILIVEDDPDNLETLSTYLEYYKFSVNTATDGQEALDSIASDKPDVILLDLMIPKINGWEVAKQIKSNEETKGIIVIAFSAMAIPHEMEKALASGCDAFLAKPMSPDLLVEEMMKIINKNK